MRVVLNPRKIGGLIFFDARTGQKIEDFEEWAAKYDEDRIRELVSIIKAELRSGSAARSISDVPSKDWDAGKRIVFLSEAKKR